MINKKIKINKGFTLIELMVATTIFMIIMLVSMGSLIITLGAARDARALRFAMDNVNFAMESMTRSIRMGTNYTCFASGESLLGTGTPVPEDCEEGDKATMIAFIPQKKEDTERIGYRLSGEKTREDGTIYRTIERFDLNGNPTPVISSTINITKLNFVVSGSNLGDTKQASVRVIIRGEVMIGETPQSFSIQTLASQRNF